MNKVDTIEEELSAIYWLFTIVRECLRFLGVLSILYVVISVLLNVRINVSLIGDL